MIGYKIHESDAMVDILQFRFPRCKSKRIHKKWRKRPVNFRTTPKTEAIVNEVHKIIYCHPVVAHALRLELKRQSESTEIYDRARRSGLLF